LIDAGSGTLFLLVKYENYIKMHTTVVECSAILVLIFILVLVFIRFINHFILILYK